jgi:putative sterol carrier protein
MIPLDLPADTTPETLLRAVAPAFHAAHVPGDAPVDPLTVAVRIDGAGGWTLRIRGREMQVEDGEAAHPTLWTYTTARTVERFLLDARGPRRWLPKEPPPIGTVAFSDPRLVKRAALANGRIEFAIPDVDGERIAIVFGFGTAARRPIDPEDPDAVVEATFETVGRMLAGNLPPDEALAEGAVRVRGNRLLAMQLALAHAPFYSASVGR